MQNQSVKKKSNTVAWIFVILLVMVLGFSLFLNFALGLALLGDTSFPRKGHDTPVDESPVFEEEWSYGYGETKVVRMDLTGFITRESEGRLFEAPRDKIEDLKRSIRAARNDIEVKAIILEIDSPGGGITPSDELYQELMAFKQSSNDRKVVIFMRDLAASGGYYVALAGDWLIAQPTTIIGSIGVIMQTLNWKGFSEKIGITDTTIKSGENKDLLNPFRESDPAQIIMLQEMIDSMHRRFKHLVAESRDLDPEKLDQLSDGRIFTSDQALEYALIDQVGYWDDVVDKTAQLLGVSAIKVVRYYQKQSFWDLFAGVRSPFPGVLHNINSPVSFQYLWRP